jgi:hypothetical protein
MSDPEKPKIRVAKGRDHKKRRRYLLRVSHTPDTWFRMRRVDLPTLLLEGILPTPLLRAVDMINDVRRRAVGLTPSATCVNSCGGVLSHRLLNRS